MNLNLNQCQLHEALTRVIDGEINLKPFIALNYDDFTFNKNTAYIGRFYGAGLIVPKCKINNENSDVDIQGNCIFTEFDEGAEFAHFEGYVIKTQLSLYKDEFFAFKFSNVYDGCRDSHPKSFIENTFYSSMSTTPDISDTGRKWYKNPQLTVLVEQGTYAHTSSPQDVINLDNSGTQKALVCK
jgi:hypothetical protein